MLRPSVKQLLKEQKYYSVMFEMNDCRLQSLRVTPRTSNEPSFGLSKILTEIYNDFSD